MREFADRELWFVGIGGIGMSGIALVAQARGAIVGGSDIRRSTITDRLEENGIKVVIGHDSRNVPDASEVVVSSAISADNPEAFGREVLHRSTILAELLDPKKSIVVAGAHGKTTTASMIAYCLDRLGDDPTFLIGGEIPQLGANARNGQGWTVVEGDESDGSLLELSPTIAVITNIDHDHHSVFASRAQVEKLFEDWLNGAAADANVVLGDESVLEHDCSISVPGEHNRLNAACAVRALEYAGFEREKIRSVITDFTGVSRRLESHGCFGEVLLFDDYAHHPTEIEETLRAIRSSVDFDGRLIVLFQPHLFTRTAYLAHEFGKSLSFADAVCVTSIYPAREEPIAGVSEKLIVNELSAYRPGMRIGLASSLEDAALVVTTWARPGDVILTLGAGDVNESIQLITERLL